MSDPASNGLRFEGMPQMIEISLQDDGIVLVTIDDMKLRLAPPVPGKDRVITFQQTAVAKQSSRRGTYTPYVP